MAPIRLEVVTPERMLLEEDVDIVVARGADGDIGILHGHEPLITPLATGELMYRAGGQDQHLAISGGFLEVRPDKVVVLADVAERSEEIDRGPVGARTARDRSAETTRKRSSHNGTGSDDPLCLEQRLSRRCAGRQDR